MVQSKRWLDKCSLFFVLGQSLHSDVTNKLPFLFFKTELNSFSFLRCVSGPSKLPGKRELTFCILAVFSGILMR